MSQTKKQSMVEVCVGTAIGIVGSLAITMSILHTVHDRVIAGTVTVAVCTGGCGGFAIVPVEPTEAMIKAGIDEMPHFTDEPGPVWSAMIAASQQKGVRNAS